MNVTMGYPFEQSALFGLCDLWLSIQEALLSDADVNYKHVLSFLFNPLIPIDPDLRNELHNQIVDEKKVSFSRTELLRIGKIATITFNPFADSFTTIRHLASVLLYVSEEGNCKEWIACYLPKQLKHLMRLRIVLKS